MIYNKYYYETISDNRIDTSNYTDLLNSITKDKDYSELINIYALSAAMRKYNRIAQKHKSLRAY